MTRKTFAFGSFTLDLAKLCLRGPAGEVELRPKSFEVLRYFVENAGRVVSKEEVMSAVWPDVTVTDDSLTRCVSEVRRAIGDDGQRAIRTVPRRGYLWDVPVSPGASLTGAEARRSTVRQARPLDSERGSDRSPLAALPDRPSIAVLPFANLSGNPDENYFSDGITEDIITELSRFSELLVIARHSSFQYKGRTVDVRQVGRDLGVRYVLEGSVRRDGDRVRITALLIDAATGAHRPPVGRVQARRSRRAISRRSPQIWPSTVKTVLQFDLD